MDFALVSAIVGVAALYLAVRFYHQIKASRSKTGGECPGCGTCGKEESKPVPNSNGHGRAK